MNIYALELARIPNVSLKILLRLCKTILRGELPQTHSMIEAAAENLQAYVDIVNAALIARIVGSNPALLATEMSFDRAVDALWAQLLRRLDDALAYEHSGLDMLTDEQSLAAELAHSRAQAQRARDLLTRVFGSTTLSDLVKVTFVEQAESTATILRMIEQEGLRQDFEDIVGAQLMRTLDNCQLRYETMIDDRLNRQRGMGQDHRELRNQLRWRLIAYVNAVQSLYQPAQPETGEQVVAHLQSILTLRESLSRNTNEAELEAELEDFAELDLSAPAPAPVLMPVLEPEAAPAPAPE
ncbi:hypothetical protein ENSA5_37820 [Enhygromyxa salina]|uniref:Uncharacterized protein n=1 Tax=Enhygromyxa salina TaxID=215803 RepID=A0A2S9XS14_9BACT|nr:hypothetical protein [Enhygromyxa salina]PRP95649.1 hypothetical protein ENSA5_37820 [Enhygromyxa salina]